MSIWQGTSGTQQLWSQLLVAYADHRRKHTGERPFQCHCSRRFSRLDNLRQHAQTVHVNEEIPQDSLAATGTRFQRQVRTDRVRPPGSRSKASTVGSQTGQTRGHQRNSLSTSSIASVGSVYSQRDGGRPRPAPLVMAGEPRQRYSQEIYRPASPADQYQYRNQSPSGFSTPTSATFSTGQNSPRWGSAMQSPISSHSRTASLYAGHRTPGRRLSVPSVGNPFQSPHGNSYGPPALGPMNSSNMGAFSPSSTMISSPTTSTTGSIAWSRRESVSSAADDALRRRTWHPDTSNFTNFTSRLQNVTAANYYSPGPPPPPSQVVPSNAQPLPQQNTMRLPGIESFDPLPRPVTPIRRQPSPMMIDNPSRAPMPQSQPEPYQERPSSQQWDMGINRNLNNLNIAQTPPTDAASWASDTQRAVQAQAEQSRMQQQQPAVRFEESPYSARTQPNSAYHQHTISAPPITPKEAKRHGWYHGPVSVVHTTSPAQHHDPRIQRTSPEDSSSSEGGIPGTPSTSSVAEFNPSIMHSNGWVENRNGGSFPAQQDPRAAPAPNGYTSYAPQNGTETAYTYTPGQAPPQIMQARMQGQVPKNTDSNMLRLEALVAVATSEENVSAAAY